MLLSVRLVVVASLDLNCVPQVSTVVQSRALSELKVTGTRLVPHCRYEVGIRDVVIQVLYPLYKASSMVGVRLLPTLLGLVNFKLLVPRSK